MNRDRWIQAIVVLVSIALIVWIARHTFWDEVTVRTPLKGEAARNPYYAVLRLARDLGIQSRTIGSLDGLPPDGIVLVNSLSNDLRHGSLESLQAWVQAGGRLIIRGNTLDFSVPLQTWSGIRHRERDPDDSQRPAPGTRPTVLSVEDLCKPLAVTVEGVVTGRPLVICNGLPMGYSSQRLPAWALSDSNGIQALRVRIGRGQLTVIGPYLMLSNWGLPNGDHAQIFVAAAGLRHGDRLDILSPTKAQPLLALLWGLAAPAILFLCAAALMMILRHLPRFGPPIPVVPPIRRSLAEQIRANARFAWRTRKLASLRAAIRRALDEAACKQIAGYDLMVPRKRAEALARRTGLDASTITAALVSDSTGGVNEDRAAITLLDACRRILIDSDPYQRHPV